MLWEYTRSKYLHELIEQELSEKFLIYQHPKNLVAKKILLPSKIILLMSSIPCQTSKNSIFLIHKTQTYWKQRRWLDLDTMRKLLYQWMNNHSVHHFTSRVNLQDLKQLNTWTRAVSRRRQCEISLIMRDKFSWPRSQSTIKLKKLSFSRNTSSWNGKN